MQLLPDKPLNKQTSKSIDFAYDELSKSIVELVAVSPKPFTIGLFGKWGTGKSTIIETLRSTLDKRKYVFVKFDVWKYESDALRRSFLIDLAEQLKGRPIFSRINDAYIKRLKNRLYTTTQYNKEKLKLSWRTVVVISVAVAVGLGVYGLLNANMSLEAVVVTVAGLVGLDILKTLLLDKSNFTQQISVGEDRVNSPEEFYSEFKALLGMSKKTFVIVIDNLDRTQKEKTVELLSTVKTFLNADDTNDNVVFIIASDDKAIKEHITSTYANSSTDSRFDAGEFLKKFFNVTIDIPVFIESEIGSYTKKLLNQTGIPEFKNNTDLQQIINYGYRENPREIKQYINNLAAYYVLLSQGVPKNGLTQDFVVSNLNFVCKLLVVRDKFETIFTDMKTLAIDNSLKWSEIERRLKETRTETDLDKTVKEFFVFSSLTTWCTPSDESIAWFFRLRRSQEDQRLPGWDLFVNAALQQDYENASKLFSDFTDMDALNSQLQTYINGIRNDAVRFTPFYSVYVRILLGLDEGTLEQLKVSIDLVILHTPGATEFNKIASSLDFTSMTEKLSKYARPASFTEYTKSIIRWLAESAGSATNSVQESDAIKLIEAVDKASPKLDSVKAQLRKLIARHHSTQAVLAVMASKPEKLKGELLADSALKRFLATIQPNEPVAVEQYALIQYFNVMPVLAEYLEKLYTLTSAINARGVSEEKAKIIHSTYLALKTHADEMVDLQDPALSNLVRISDMYAGWYAEQPTDADRAVLVLTLILFSRVRGNTSAANAQDRLEKFVSQADVGEVVELLKNSAVDVVLEQVQSSIRERMATYSESIRALLPYVSEAQLPYIVSHVSQKASDTNNEETYRTQLELVHLLYSKVQAAEQATVSDYIYSALKNGISKFPEAVKAYWSKKFISTEQRRQLKQTMNEYEATQNREES